jgi:hypothetical protein
MDESLLEVLRKTPTGGIMKRVNRKGVLALADKLTQEAKLYDQHTFGTPKAACGTVCCLAGHAYALEIGAKQFNKEAKLDSRGIGSNNFYLNCVEAGKKLLGLNTDLEMNDLTDRIFGTEDDWPDDLYNEYDGATTSKQRVIVALKALSRLRVDGTIDPDPKKIHTKIPHLEGCDAK